MKNLLTKIVIFIFLFSHGEEVSLDRATSVAQNFLTTEAGVSGPNVVLAQTKTAILSNGIEVVTYYVFHFNSNHTIKMSLS